MHRDTSSCLEAAISSLELAVHSVRGGDAALKSLQGSDSVTLAVFLTVDAPNQPLFDLVADIRVIDANVMVIVVAQSCSARDVVTAIRHGATDFLCPPIHPDQIECVLASASEGAGVRVKSLGRDGITAPAFHSNNYWMKEIELRAAKVGRSDVPVLIQGETGSGKEMLARILHLNSARASRPFLKLNCAALPPELVESELFGYERGAFTGAFERKTGIFEAADGGTILLDEIGDMDIRLQAKLLQVLQDQEFRRIGGRETVRVDVRVIAATHRDLKTATIKNQFREDLYYRLNVVVLHVPALRERVEDIIPLAEFLIRKHTPPNVPCSGITADLKRVMTAYSWPGNVRELENCMRNLIALRDPHALTVDLQARTSSRASVASIAPAGAPVITMDLHEETPIFEQVTKVNKQAERNAILAALNATRWNRKRAAALLKIDYKSLLYKLKRLNIDDGPIPAPAHAEMYPPKTGSDSD